MVHIPATIAFMAYSYSVFHPQVFQSTRRTLVLSNCLAFIIFSSWPCMPPRLMPQEEFGYVDTLHVGKAASIWTTNKVSHASGTASVAVENLADAVKVPESARSFPESTFRVQLCHVSHTSHHVNSTADESSGLSLWAYSPHKIIRILAPFYPVLILLVIMVSPLF